MHIACPLFLSVYLCISLSLCLSLSLTPRECSSLPPLLLFWLVRRKSQINQLSKHLVNTLQSIHIFSIAFCIFQLPSFFSALAKSLTCNRPLKDAGMLVGYLVIRSEMANKIVYAFKQPKSLNGPGHA